MLQLLEPPGKFCHLLLERSYAFVVLVSHTCYIAQMRCKCHRYRV